MTNVLQGKFVYSGFSPDAAFDTIWAECIASRAPAPFHRKMAKFRYLMTVRNEDDAERCAQAQRNYARAERVRRGYIQDASTWFDDWESWVDVTPSRHDPDGLSLAADNTELRRLDEIREAANAHAHDPEWADYIAWLAPDRAIRADRLTYEEWRARLSGH